MGHFVRNRITTRLIIAAVAVCGVAYRLIGLGKSIWLDEAWVANSVTAGSLTGMFYYDAWLQTSPPLFLLLVRGTVNSLGLTSSVLRLVPLFFGLLSMVCMFLLARRVLAGRFTLPAWTMLVFSPIAIRYSKALKQYSLELAAATVILLACAMYLERPTIRRFWLLLTTVAVCLLMAYSVAFLLPGIVLVVCLAEIPDRWRGLLRGLILATVAGGMLLGVYVLFVSPNTSFALRSFWVKDRGAHSVVRTAVADGYGLLSQLPIPSRVLEKRGLVGAAVGLMVLVGFALAAIRFHRGRRRWLEIQFVCVVPCLLLIVCSGLSWYPLTSRTSLFLLPGLILLLLGSLQLVSDFVMHRFGRKWLEPLLNVALVCMTLLLVWAGIVKQPMETLSMPGEDVASMISFLRSNVRQGDLLWVHASCSESFKLYAKMTDWSDVSARVGHTGWPCCPRGFPAIKGSGTEESVRSDLNSGIPGDFSGRVWLLYTKRADHWEFVGVNEPRIMDSVFRERGCNQRPTPVFHNIGVSLFDCSPTRATAASPAGRGG